MNLDKSYYLLYDSDCGICSELAVWLCKNGYGTLFSIQPYLEFDFSQFPEITTKLASETIVLIDIENRKFYTYGEAVLFMMDLMGGRYKKISKIIRLFELTNLINTFYRFVAKNRSKISEILGMKSCKIKT